MAICDNGSSVKISDRVKSIHLLLPVYKEILAQTFFDVKLQKYTLVDAFSIDLYVSQTLYYIIFTDKNRGCLSVKPLIKGS